VPLATHSLLFRDLARMFLTLLVAVSVALALLTAPRAGGPAAENALVSSTRF